MTRYLLIAVLFAGWCVCKAWDARAAVAVYACALVFGAFALYGREVEALVLAWRFA